MDLEKHLITTDGAGKNIHLFLDHFYKYFKEDHRLILHHQEGIKIVGSIFDEDTMIIAENHIRDDWFGALPKNQLDRNFYRYEWAYDLHLFTEALEFTNEFLIIWR